MSNITKQIALNDKKKLKNTTGLTLKTVITAEVHINYTTLQKHPPFLEDVIIA